MPIFVCGFLNNIQKYSKIQNMQGKNIRFLYGLKGMFPLITENIFKNNGFCNIVKHRLLVKIVVKIRQPQKRDLSFLKAVTFSFN